MEATIKAIHFDVSEKLVSFINKKIEKMARRFEFIKSADVVLKVIKPETNNNKEVQIKFIIPSSSDIFASKAADTFEEAINMCMDALEGQLEKIKSKN